MVTPEETGRLCLGLALSFNHAGFRDQTPVRLLAVYPYLLNHVFGLHGSFEIHSCVVCIRSGVSSHLPHACFSPVGTMPTESSSLRGRALTPMNQAMPSSSRAKGTQKELPGLGWRSRRAVTSRPCHRLLDSSFTMDKVPRKFLSRPA